MKGMITLSILLMVLGVGAAIWKKRELPQSISAMVYLLPEGGSRWLWTLWLMVVGVMTFAPAIDILDPIGYGYLGFAPMVTIGFVAVWPLFDVEHRTHHNVLGIMSGILSQVCVALIGPWWLLCWLLMAGVMAWCAMHGGRGRVRTLFSDGCGVLVSEMICWASVNAAYITHYLTT